MNWKNLLIASLVALPLAAHSDDVAFFYALDADFRKFRAEASVLRRPVELGGRSIQVLKLGNHRIYAAKMGSGTAETAGCAEAVLGRFHCDLAISIGPVGALSDELKLGNWYRALSVVGYQKGSWTRSGFQLSKTAALSLSGEPGPKLALPALFQNLKSIAVASGEIFVASTKYREQLRETTQADAVDMNLFGLASISADHLVPLFNWRIVSDRADDNASADFRKFTQTYDGTGGKAVADLIRDLPPNPNSPQSYPEIEKLLKNKSEQ